MKYLMLDKKRELGFFRNEKGTGAEMCPAIVCGIVIRDASVSYWPMFSPLSLATVPEVIARVSFLFLKWRIKDLDSGLGESITFQTFFMALIPLSPAYSKTNL